MQKRVQRTAHPDLDGESAYDMGMNSWEFPLTFYFSGSDCDIAAADFSRALAERGVWKVTHPVFGVRLLQPVKITVRARPVESGNVIEISSDWFEPVTDALLPGEAAGASSFSRSPTETAGAAGAVKAATAALAEAAIADASGIAPRASASAFALRSATSQLRKGLDAVKKALRSASARVTAIMGSINDLLLQPYLDIAAISGAVIQLAESPGLFIGNISSRVSMFAKLGRRIMADLPAAVNFSSNQIAAALSGELWLDAIAAGMGTTVTEGLPETRAEALAALRGYREFAAASRNALGALAKASAGSAITDQYFPRAASAETVLTLNAAVARYVMDIAFSLRAEKTITLERPENPMLLAIREYGASAANADYYFDLLARSNGLHGRELLLLDRNREVKIYA
jgi:hypothetical protein